MKLKRKNEIFLTFVKSKNYDLNSLTHKKCNNTYARRYEVVMMKMTNYNEDDNSLVSYIVKVASVFFLFFKYHFLILFLFYFIYCGLSFHTL